MTDDSNNSKYLLLLKELVERSNGWKESSKYVLKELERLNECYRNLDDRVNRINVSIAKLSDMIMEIEKIRLANYEQWKEINEIKQIGAENGTSIKNIKWIIGLGFVALGAIIAVLK